MVSELNGIIANGVEGIKHGVRLPLVGMLHHIGIQRCPLKNIAAVDDENIVICTFLAAGFLDDGTDFGQADIGRLGGEVIPADDTAVNIGGRKYRQITGKCCTGCDSSR